MHARACARIYTWIREKSDGNAGKSVAAAEKNRKFVKNRPVGRKTTQAECTADSPPGYRVQPGRRVDRRKEVRDGRRGRRKARQAEGAADERRCGRKNAQAGGGADGRRIRRDKRRPAGQTTLGQGRRHPLSKQRAAPDLQIFSAPQRFFLQNISDYTIIITNIQ